MKLLHDICHALKRPRGVFLYAGSRGRGQCLGLALLAVLTGACVPQDDPVDAPVLTELARVEVGSGFPLVLADDLDGDGLDELLVADAYAGEYPRSESGEVRVLAAPVSSGDWTELSARLVARGREPFRRYGSGLAAADLDGDGIKDLVLRADSSIDNVGTVRVLSGALTGEVEVESSAFLTMTGSATLGQAMLGMDYNSDGNEDLVVSCPLRSEVYVVLGPQSGGIRLPDDADATLFAESGSLGWSACSADFDGDGVSDLALAESAGDDIYVLQAGLTGRHAVDQVAWAVIRSVDERDDLTGCELLEGTASAGLFVRSRRTDTADRGSLFVLPGPIPGGQLELRRAAQMILDYATPVLGASSAWVQPTPEAAPLLVVGTTGFSHIPASNLKGGLWLFEAAAAGEFELDPAAIQPHGHHVRPQDMNLDWLGRSVLSASLENPSAQQLIVTGRGALLVLSLDQP